MPPESADTLHAADAVAAVCRWLAQQGAWRVRQSLTEPVAQLDTVVGPQAHDGAELLEALAALFVAHPHRGQTQYQSATVRRLENAIALEALPPLLARTPLQALPNYGLASADALAVLHAALDTGRNVLMAGAYGACWPLMAALVEGGRQPAALAGAGTPSVRWWPLRRASEAGACGADRVALWGQDARSQRRDLASCLGGVGHIEAVDIEQALMRFEAGARAQQGPLAVVSGISLVAVCSADAQLRPKLVGVYEIVTDDAGYRPRPLFACGQPDGPLQFVALPTFVQALGQNEVVRALQLAQGQAAEVPGAAPAPAPAAQPLPIDSLAAESASSMATALARQRHVSTRADPGRTRSPRVPPRMPRGEAALQSLVRPPGASLVPSAELSPGWELEQDSQFAAQDEPDGGARAATYVPGARDAQGAALAANFGLGPPQPPEGVDASDDDARADAFLAALKASSRAQAALPAGEVTTTTAAALPHDTMDPLQDPAAFRPRLSAAESTEVDAVAPRQPSVAADGDGDGDGANPHSPRGAS